MYEQLQIGEIVNTQGVKGEIKVIPLTDDPKRFESLEWVYVDKNGKVEKYEIDGIKYIKNLVILKFAGIDTLDAAEKLKGSFILIDRKYAVKLPRDSYFICDLIGMEVQDEHGTILGKLVEVLSTGSNDVYVVKGADTKEILIPALKSIVNEISFESATIKVTIPKGLISDEV